jgi:predicted Holliday junction resolvase-like endonuclease
MSGELPLIIVSAVAVFLLAALLWVGKRYGDVRADHARQLKQAREQSVRQSRSVLLGKAFEQIVPMAPIFCERFSASDARFLGAPIDYVIFDGLHRGEVDHIVFLEVKSGAKAALNKNERAVRRAIAEGRVEFQVMSLPLGHTRVDTLLPPELPPTRPS